MYADAAIYIHTHTLRFEIYHVLRYKMLFHNGALGIELQHRILHTMPRLNANYI